jgi:isopenicillin-N epimerase
MQTRRDFLRTSGQSLTSASVWLAASASLIRSIESAAASSRWPDDDSAARDEVFWSTVARAFIADGRYIVLNGGGQNPPPKEVIEALTSYEAHAAAQPRPNNDRLITHVEQHRRRLAQHLGCEPDEVAITRNTTEGLNIVANGVELQSGDEVIYTSFDEYYGARPLRLRAARQGVVLRKVDLPIPPPDDVVVERIAAAITPRTKLIVASHIADGWGYVLPIAKISALARSRGVPVLADGALAFGHVVVNVRELGCDYYVSSLHKWLSAPLGTGLLYVRRDRIAALWPLYGVGEPESANIRKFEQIGTRAGAPLAAIGQALDFHETIGPGRKAARLRYLGSYVLEGLRGAPGVQCFTDADERRRGSLMRILVKGLSGEAVEKQLREKYGIWTFGRLGSEWDGIYISPNLFNLPAHLDQFANAMREIAAEAVKA